MNKKRLDEISARAESATKVPWEVGYGQVGYDDYLSVTHKGKSLAHIIIDKHEEMPTFEQDASALFIAHARQDIPDLLAYVKELEEEVKRLETICYGYTCPSCSTVPGENNE